MELLTVKETQKLLRIGERTAYKLFNKPGFPGIAIGGKLMVDKKDLEEYIESYKGSKIEL